MIATITSVVISGYGCLMPIRPKPHLNLSLQKLDALRVRVCGVRRLLVALQLCARRAREGQMGVDAGGCGWIVQSVIWRRDSGLLQKQSAIILSVLLEVW
jgi:hypothetical protein